MQVFFSPDHARHAGRAELHRGELVPCFERPERAEIVREAVRADGHDITEPPPADRSAIERVHPSAYVDFLETAYDQWRGLGREGDATPHTWRVRSDGPPPESLFGQLGHYVADAGTPITAGTWDALRAGAGVAEAARAFVDGGNPAALALSRPPGHHAAADLAGGYCFVNFAALAAEGFRHAGEERVAVLDVDFHHGNGTQDVFYARGDVLFASLHGDPATSYPYFSGHAAEAGVGEGAGFTVNAPLPDGTAWPAYEAALGRVLERVAAFGPGRLVVSLGVDTFEADPISAFALRTGDFASMAGRIASLGVPAVIVLEGGYHLPSVGRNVAAFLGGWA